MSGKRIVFTAFGSLGDLHPYLAIALELKARGHDAIIATSPSYRHTVEALGIGFRRMRPDQPDWRHDRNLMANFMDSRKGSEWIICQWLMPVLRQSYEDVSAAAEGADLMVSHPLAFATRLVAEVRGLPWASTVLEPFLLFSAYDPPILDGARLLSKLRPLGPSIYGLLFGLLKHSVRSWCAPWHRFRAELGLPPAPAPLFEGQHSPTLVLALFSPLLAAKQPDWPPQTLITGFPFYDQDAAAGIDGDLARFLADGPPPIVFTLGTTAVWDAGRFYQDSVAAACKLGQRAVLLVGSNTGNRPSPLPPSIAVFEYAPFSQLFPRAAAIVHQGGIGTTAQALRAGRPMLIVPFAHDQPDNAKRMLGLGVAQAVPRKRFTADGAASALRTLLGNNEYSRRAAALARRVQGEDGVAASCDALEGLIDQQATSVYRLSSPRRSYADAERRKRDLPAPSEDDAVIPRRLGSAR